MSNLHTDIRTGDPAIWASGRAVALVLRPGWCLWGPSQLYSRTSRHLVAYRKSRAGPSGPPVSVSTTQAEREPAGRSP